MIGYDRIRLRIQLRRAASELSRRFEEHFGTTQCSELLKNISRKSSLKPMERDEQYYKERPCVALVSYAARELEAWIEEYRAAQAKNNAALRG